MRKQKAEQQKTEQQKDLDLASKIKRLLLAEYRASLTYYGEQVFKYKENNDKTKDATRFGAIMYAQGQADMCGYLEARIDLLIAKERE